MPFIDQEAVGFPEGMIVVVWEHDSIVESFSSAPFTLSKRKVDRDRQDDSVFQVR